MRSRRLRLLALVVLPAVLLTGCADSANEGSNASGTMSVSSDFAGITVDPASGTSAPTLELPTKPFRTQDGQFRVITPGTGADIPADASLTVAHAMYAGTDGRQLATSFTEHGSTLALGDESTPEMFTKAFEGQKTGVRVLVGVPAHQMYNQASLPAGLTMDDALLFVIDVRDVRKRLNQAEGTAVPPKAGLPTVEVPQDTSQPAKITVPSPTPLKETVAQPLIVGAGAKVTKGQTVRFTYTGATWRDPATPFDYSGKYPNRYMESPIGVGQLIKAWDEHIVGQPVGSRLLLVVQPADGYGSAGGGNGQIKGDDVLIFVLDILDAY